MYERPILIVEDDDDLRAVVASHLRREGFATIEAANGKDGLKRLAQSDVMLVLLDLQLGDIRGTELCRHIRATPSTASVPVVILSAHGEEIDRVVAFEVGADDFVVKSQLSLRELGLRIRAVLRRSRAAAAPRSPPVTMITIDHEGRRAWAAGREVVLTPTEFRLLGSLLDRPGQAISRSALMAELRGTEDNDHDSRVVDTYIKRLRQKLGGAASAIVTVRGVGYRYDADVPS